MPTRRQFCQTVATAAIGSLVPNLVQGSTMPEPQKPYRTDKPMLQLQQEFVDLRFGMFLHFNMATFQDREWGDPKGPVEAFNPTNLDTDQWAQAAKSAGMTYGCLTTKHHDGFCIWPTKTKVASILQTPQKTDVVKAYADSFRKHGLKVGLYYSILDLRNDIRHHNITPEQIQLIKDQLTELLTSYGEINILIFDGWDAPWSRIPYDEVPFQEIYALVKQLQPNCLISELNASEYPPSALYYTDIKAFEQNAGQHIPGGNILPAQSCVTLTDGWFWKLSDEKAELKSVKQVVEEWLIPQNKQFCCTILNAAPNREGRLSQNIVDRLAEIGKAWKHPGPAPKLPRSVIITSPNLATGQTIHASDSPDTVGPDQANDGSFRSTWHLPEGQSEGWLEITFKQETEFNTLVLVEPIGRWEDYSESRIKSYAFQRWDGGKWVDVVKGTAPAPVQIHSVPNTKATRLRLSFTSGEKGPHISEIGVYSEPR